MYSRNKQNKNLFVTSIGEKNGGALCTLPCDKNEELIKTQNNNMHRSRIRKKTRKKKNVFLCVAFLPYDYALPHNAPAYCAPHDVHRIYKYIYTERCWLTFEIISIIFILGACCCCVSIVIVILRAIHIHHNSGQLVSQYYCCWTIGLASSLCRFSFLPCILLHTYRYCTVAVAAGGLHRDLTPNGKYYIHLDMYIYIYIPNCAA